MRGECGGGGGKGERERENIEEACGNENKMSERLEVFFGREQERTVCCLRNTDDCGMEKLFTRFGGS